MTRRLGGPRASLPAFALLAAAAAAPAGAQTHGQAQLNEAGDWSWYELAGRRIANTYPEDGAELRVECPTEDGRPGRIGAWFAGEPVVGSAGLSFDGGAPIETSFLADGFVSGTESFEGLLGRLRAGGELTLTYVAGASIRYSLNGASAAIGDCR
ncbi:MAG: hypothetical protein AAGI51_07125 [Pseudomonadota bacterium]